MYKYIEYIKENIENNTFKITCEINEKYLLQISGQKNINDAIQNELGYIDTIEIVDIEKIKTHEYLISIKVDNNKIKQKTGSNNIEDSIKLEFNWLDQSGIEIKNIE